MRGGDTSAEACPINPSKNNSVLRLQQGEIEGHQGIRFQQDMEPCLRELLAMKQKTNKFGPGGVRFRKRVVCRVTDSIFSEHLLNSFCWLLCWF